MPFALVVGREEVEECLTLGAEAGAQRQLGRREHGSFGGTHRERRHRGDAVAELERRIHDVRPPATTDVTSPAASRLGRAHRPTRQHQLHGACQPDGPCQPLGPAGAGHDADAGSPAGRTGRRRPRR